jgi:hypothetical protein
MRLPQNLVRYLFVVVSGFGLLTSQFTSAAILTAGFDVKIAPSARVLGAMGTAMETQVRNEEACDNPLLRTRARNKPAVMVTNSTMSDAPIDSFTIRISDGPYLFGDGDNSMDNFNGFIRETVYSPDGVTITGSTLSSNGTQLTVHFDGLTAGKSVIFNIDLDANDMDMFPFPDFRSVLFGAPMNAGDAPTDPAVVSALFLDDSGEEPMTRRLERQLQQITEVPAYANSRIRPYHVNDPIEVVGIGTMDVVPEPASATAALIALTLGLAHRRRR